MYFFTNTSNVISGDKRENPSKTNAHSAPSSGQPMELFYNSLLWFVDGLFGSPIGLCQASWERNVNGTGENALQC